jgi:TldD protein
MWYRRQFLARSAAAVALTALPRIGSSVTRSPRQPSVVDPHFLVEDPQWRTLTERAIDAALRAGAQYADIRLARTIEQHFNIHHNRRDIELYSIGVRAFVKGYWGFAASQAWTLEEAEILGREAAAQAMFNARGLERPVELAPALAVTGSWVMPVKIDPFTVPLEERMELLRAWEYSWASDYGRQARTRRERALGIVTMSAQASFYNLNGVIRRQERVVATSEGTYVTQVTYHSGIDADMHFARKTWDDPLGRRTTPKIPFRSLRLAAQGWETFLDAPIRSQIPHLEEEGRELVFAGVMPVDVGRYDIVTSADVAAQLVDATLGRATELDRALGYEANASGTSFLGPDPLEFLGGEPIASPLLTVTADRTMPKGLATAKWDDEGVETHEFPLIQDGVVVDYQTTRELAGELAPWYQRRGLPVRSHACAVAGGPTPSITMSHIPNLSIVPSKESVSLDDLIRDTKRGLLILNGKVETNFQVKNGVLTGLLVREIRNGKPGPIINDAGVLFGTVELWKNLIALGGEASAEMSSASATKGEPEQMEWHSVRAVPLKFKELAVIDTRRKA